MDSTPETANQATGSENIKMDNKLEESKIPQERNITTNSEEGEWKLYVDTFMNQGVNMYLTKETIECEPETGEELVNISFIFLVTFCLLT